MLYSHNQEICSYIKSKLNSVMFKHHKYLLTLPFIFSVSVKAAENLSLDTMEVCDFSLAYMDKGSGGRDDVAIYTPNIPAEYFMIGAYAQGDYYKTSQCVIAVKPSTPKTSQDVPLLMKPENWQAIWLDKGTGANMDGSIWHAMSPHADYVCIGSVGQSGYHPPRLPRYRCLHKCLVEEVPVPDLLWSDIGTGAKQPVSLYKLQSSKSFYAQPDRNRPLRLFDLKTTPVCTGTLDTVIIEPETSHPVPLSGSKEWINPDELQKQPPPRSDKEWVNPDVQ